MTDAGYSMRGTVSLSENRHTHTGLLFHGSARDTDKRNGEVNSNSKKGQNRNRTSSEQRELSLAALVNTRARADDDEQMIGSRVCVRDARSRSVPK